MAATAISPGVLDDDLAPASSMGTAAGFARFSVGYVLITMHLDLREVATMAPGDGGGRGWRAGDGGGRGRPRALPDTEAEATLSAAGEGHHRRRAPPREMRLAKCRRLVLAGLLATGVAAGLYREGGWCWPGARRRRPRALEEAAVDFPTDRGEREVGERDDAIGAHEG